MWAFECCWAWYPRPRMRARVTQKSQFGYRNPQNDLLSVQMGTNVFLMGTYGIDIQAALVTQVKAEMAARDMKQPDLAEKAGIPTSTLHRYLSGVRDIPMPVAISMASALELSLVELFQRAERRLEGKNVQ
ncbi:phage repressor protein [Arthrobacter phage vB_ArS-ArV2]|uniref:Phage repressor protein n=1 Tax=Arthrobacter phage vB_ArS-ArV2 TaxID=1414742 RepID=V5RAB9_9CAUD|nr:phage repressor protein [Arthrobacter phage vB_ArS-ArV2]AHB31645.1 phage repressor protein [Arthrobacter phage vB_ArS-ArV2]